LGSWVKHIYWICGQSWKTLAQHGNNQPQKALNTLIPIIEGKVSLPERADAKRLFEEIMVNEPAAQ